MKDLLQFLLKQTILYGLSHAFQKFYNLINLDIWELAIIKNSKDSLVSILPPRIKAVTQCDYHKYDLIHLIYTGFVDEWAWSVRMIASNPHMNEDKNINTFDKLDSDSSELKNIDFIKQHANHFGEILCFVPKKFQTTIKLWLEP